MKKTKTRNPFAHMVTQPPFNMKVIKDKKKELNKKSTRRKGHPNDR